LGDSLSNRQSGVLKPRNSDITGDVIPRAGERCLEAFRQR
jgi:hypothetical protein